MEKFHAILDAIVYLVFGLALIGLEFLIRGPGGSFVSFPFIFGMVLSAILLTLFVMAAYESFKHRHDKDPW